jgi:hypothetical protein
MWRAVSKIPLGSRKMGGGVDWPDCAAPRGVREKNETVELLALDGREFCSCGAGGGSIKSPPQTSAGNRSRTGRHCARVTKAASMPRGLRQWRAFSGARRAARFGTSKYIRGG